MRGVAVLLSVALSLILCAGARSATVVQNSVKLVAPPPSPPASFALTVYQNVALTDPTSTWFDLTSLSDPVTGYPTNVLHLKCRSFNLDEGSDWYVASPNQVFPLNLGQPLVAAGFRNPDPYVFTYKPGGTDIYLAFATSAGNDYDARTIFGWVKLRVTDPLDGSRAILLESAQAFGAPGIIVGLPVAVPEPGSLALTAISLPMLLTALKRKRAHGSTYK